MPLVEKFAMNISKNYVTKVELPNKGQLCYFYNGNGQIEGIAHGKEKPFCQSEYDAQGRVVAQKTSKREQYTIEYNPRKAGYFLQQRPTSKTHWVFLQFLWVYLQCGIFQRNQLSTIF